MTPRTVQRDALTLGFGLAFVSAAGQSFYIGLFGPTVQAALGIDATRWGLLYSLATMAGGLSMFWLGALADRWPPPRALGAALVLLSAGACAMALAQAPLALGLALFALRLGGQVRAAIGPSFWPHALHRRGAGAWPSQPTASSSARHCCRRWW